VIVAIIGSRDFDDFAIIYKSVRKLQAKYGTDLMLVSGGATGADSIAEAAASYFHVPIEVLPADWEGQGKAAGPIRNTKVVHRADQVIAFFSPGRRSPGTTDAVKKAYAANKPTFVYQAERWETFKG